MKVPRISRSGVDRRVPRESRRSSSRATVPLATACMAAFLILAALPTSLHGTVVACRHRQAAAQAGDTVPALRWRLIATRLIDEQVSAQRAAQRAAQAGDSAALRSLPTAPPAMRINALLGATAYEAVDSARLDRGQPSRRVALAAASAVVLEHAFPHAAQELARALAHDSAAELRAGVPAARVAAGARVGRAMAAAVLQWARRDGSDVQWNGTAPTGPGMWWSANGAAPTGASSVVRRPWILTSMDQFRPAPPPAYGSPEFEAALDEVRRVARDRTPAQAQIARRWGDAGPDWWVDTTGVLLLQTNASDDVALRLLTLMAVAAYDLHGACWEAKLHYWLLRPTHADSTITLAEGMRLPNFPAYPSGHACFAGFASTLIGHFVPGTAAEVERLAEENALSRLYAGVHFRFDNDVGLDLGRRVARYVIEQEARGALRRRWH